MPDFNKVEDTLFVPLLGRMYASEHFPRTFYDEKVLELKDRLPTKIKGQDTQTQYTLMAGAVRSANMDRGIQAFLSSHPDGIIVELGCGLETAFYRNDNGSAIWYEVDLPNVISYRRELLEESERDRYIAADGFADEWIRQIRTEHPNTPILVTASGLFYYFEQQKVLNLFRQLKHYGPMEILFDTVNSKGMKQIGKYMKQVGHPEATMYFYVDSGKTMAQEVGAELLLEAPYYANTSKKGLQFMTAMTMRGSDLLKMVKMIQIRLNQSDGKLL